MCIVFEQFHTVAKYAFDDTQAYRYRFASYPLVDSNNIAQLNPNSIPCFDVYCFLVSSTLVVFILFPQELKPNCRVISTAVCFCDKDKVRINNLLPLKKEIEFVDTKTPNTDALRELFSNS